MPQVSRLPLSKDLEAQMFTLFRNVLADLHKDSDIQEFLDDLLTPTEKIMLGKRLAIAFLLERGYTQRAIHTIMKVSVTTVSAVSLWLHHKGNGYRRVIERIQAEQQLDDFIAQIDERLRFILSRKPLPGSLQMPDTERTNQRIRLRL